jgi:hypothetical protein
MCEDNYFIKTFLYITLELLNFLQIKFFLFFFLQNILVKLCTCIQINGLQHRSLLRIIFNPTLKNQLSVEVKKKIRNKPLGCVLNSVLRGVELLIFCLLSYSLS